MAARVSTARFHAGMLRMLELLRPALPDAEAERVRFGIDVVASNATLVRTVASKFRARAAPLVAAPEFRIDAELLRATMYTDKQLQLDLTKVTPELTADVLACLRDLLLAAETLK
jgi:adenosine deaminase